ncbi:MAG: NAD-dependent epimerase/dehydratase family protein [Alphaproteobacteria bacterium]|nr:NAD-dependent epimerase/dehydratase family protein [Alphaproteobacteria bacterium]
MNHGQNILVTGGAGFVGSHLVDRLVADGHKVAILDDLSSGARENVHKDAVLTVGDVRDSDLVARMIGEANACFHLAAIASVQQCNELWRNSHEINQSAFVGLLEAAAKRKTGVIPVVYASSAAVYGDTDVFPVHEDLPLRPISIYGVDKAGCELQARAAGRSAGVPTFGLRPFNIYGPRQNPSSPYSGVISVFADSIRRGKGVTIYGDGKQTRDFIAVADVVEFFVAALAKASPDAPVCNAATGKETSVLEIAQQISAALGHESRIAFTPARTGDIYRSVAATAQAEKLLGCKAGTGVEEGLKFIAKQGV